VQRYFSIFSWAKGYRRKDFAKDVVAGITVGIILVPQGMAYAMIAGLPPVHGLYASLFPVLVYAVLGTSRKNAVGPVAMDSLLVAAGLGTLNMVGPSNYIAIVALLALMVGTLQLILGLLRMGYLVNFLSRPVISGFTSAAALIIIFSQLKHLIGVPLPGSNRFDQLVVNALIGLPQTNMVDFALGLVGILALLAFKRWKRNFPAILLVVIAGVAAVYFLDLGRYGVQQVGPIAKGLPGLVPPQLDLDLMGQLLPMAIALALVGYLEAVSIGKALEERSGEETILPSQELVALGASNTIGAFFQGFPVTASFSRSAINFEAGAKTNLASIFSVLLVVLTLLFLTPIFQYLPNAILASIIMVSVFGLINVGYAKSLWATGKDEFWILILTFLVTLFVGIAEGILIGALASLLLLVYRTSKPHFAVLGNIRNTQYYKNVQRFGDEVLLRNDLLIVRFDAQLYFGNAAFFKKELMRHVALKGDLLQCVILNADAISYIDATGTEMLIRVIRELHEKNIAFYITGAIGPTRDIIFNSGIIKELQTEYLFVTTKEAVAYFEDPHSLSEEGIRIAHENRARRK
jgi:sulfate permease, SulP family